jgi:hypothetical protein
LNQQFRHRQFPAGNPLANILVVIAGIVIISLSLALGFFVFLGIATFVLVMAAVMSVRNWWYRKRFAGRPEQEVRRETSVHRQIIEGEYREVRRRREDRRDP